MTKQDALVLVVAIIVLALIFWYFNGRLRPDGTPVTQPVCVGGFLITKDYSAEKFRFDVNSVIERSLKNVKIGDCISANRLVERRNGAGELRYLTHDGYDVTEAGVKQ